MIDTKQRGQRFGTQIYPLKEYRKTNLQEKGGGEGTQTFKVMLTSLPL